MTHELKTSFDESHFTCEARGLIQVIMSVMSEQSTSFCESLKSYQTSLWVLWPDLATIATLNVFTVKQRRRLQTVQAGYLQCRHIRTLSRPCCLPFPRTMSAWTLRRRPCACPDSGREAPCLFQPVESYCCVNECSWTGSKFEYLLCTSSHVGDTKVLLIQLVLNRTLDFSFKYLLRQVKLMRDRPCQRNSMHRVQGLYHGAC